MRLTRALRFVLGSAFLGNEPYLFFAVPDALLPPRILGDALDGKINFYEAFGVRNAHFYILCNVL